jgi:hypothetical protein
MGALLAPCMTQAEAAAVLRSRLTVVCVLLRRGVREKLCFLTPFDADLPFVHLALSCPGIAPHDALLEHPLPARAALVLVARLRATLSPTSTLSLVTPHPVRVLSRASQLEKEKEMKIALIGNTVHVLHSEAPGAQTLLCKPLAPLPSGAIVSDTFPAGVRFCEPCTSKWVSNDPASTTAVVAKG